MRRSSIILVLLALFILWLVLVAYLAGSPAQQPVEAKPPGGGLVADPPVNMRYSFEEMARKVAELQIDLPDESTEKTIYYIQAEDVGDDGSAASWIYRVSSKKGASILLYQRDKWTIIPWKGGEEYLPLDPNLAISIIDLLTENQEQLARSPGQKRQVELFNNTCLVTISGGGDVRTYAFDTTTGMLAA